VKQTSILGQKKYLAVQKFAITIPTDHTHLRARTSPYISSTSTEHHQSQRAANQLHIHGSTMQGTRPAGVLLLLLAAALLLAATASLAAAGTYSGGRVVISHGAAAAAARRLEDTVAPELSWAAGLLGDGIGASALRRDKPACVHNCAAPCRGCSYTRPCTYEGHCRQPTQPRS
jgi:hypothetical protein